MTRRVASVPRLHGRNRAREVAELVDFAVKWQPFDGAPAEEILIHFGISPKQFALRLDHVLDFYDHSRLHISMEVHARMRQLCWVDSDDPESPSEDAEREPLEPRTATPSIRGQTITCRQTYRAPRCVNRHR